jgi:Dynein heavy chain AAA lid domain
VIAAPYYSPTYHPPFVAGGRVSDAYDRRVLSTYLDEYLGDFVFDACQPFHLHVARDGSTIDVLQAGHRDDYVAAIDALPLEQSPEVRHNTPHPPQLLFTLHKRHRQHCGPSEKHADNAGK